MILLSETVSIAKKLKTTDVISINLLVDGMKIYWNYIRVS